MARLATLALLLLSLLSVASCRDLEAISDDQGPPVPVLLTRDDQADAAAEVTTLPRFPAPVVAWPAWDEDKLPSHRGHLWLARHHGFFHRRGAFSRLGEARVQPAAFFPTEPDRGEEQAHWKAVLEAAAEPYHDSRADTDGEQKPFQAEEEGEENEAVKMARRFGHCVGLPHRHHHDQEEKDNHGQDKDEDMNTKLLGRFHLHAHAGELEVLGSTRRSFNHGDHHLGAEEGGVKKWFKGLMNRF